MNYKYRMHDPRIGKFFAVDPLASEFPWNSPYAFSENRLIDAVELEGAEALVIHKGVTGSVIASGSTGAGLIWGPDGAEVYGSYGFGIETDVSISTYVQLTVFPTMGSKKDALGWSYEGGVSAPKWGGTLSLGAVYSESGDWGGFVRFGLGAGVSPFGSIGFSANKAVTREVKNQEDKQMALNLLGGVLVETQAAQLNAFGRMLDINNEKTNIYIGVSDILQKLVNGETLTKEEESRRQIAMDRINSLDAEYSNIEAEFNDLTEKVDVVLEAIEDVENIKVDE